MSKDEKDDAGVKQETAEMEGPIYQVSLPAIGRLWFPENAYSDAYQWATGCLIGDERADPEAEEDITLIDFDGVAEVPLADV